MKNCMKFGQLILSKIIKIVATRYQISRLNASNSILDLWVFEIYGLLTYTADAVDASEAVYNLVTNTASDASTTSAVAYAVVIFFISLFPSPRLCDACLLYSLQSSWLYYRFSQPRDHL